MKKIYKRNWLFKLKSLAVFGSMLFAGSAAAQLSGTYTIDSAVAKGGTNFQSFTELADTLEAAGVSGPVTVDVVANSGPYNEKFEVDKNMDYGSDATNTFTLNGNGNKIMNNTGSNQNVVEIYYMNHVTISNLVIENLRTGTNGRCMFLGGAGDLSDSSLRNITIDSCEFILNGPTVNNTGSRYIHVQGSRYATDITISNNIMHGGTDPGSGAYQAIYFGGTYNVADDVRLKITGNKVSDFGHYGIYCLYPSGALIKDNEIFNRTTFTGMRYTWTQNYYAYGIYVRNSGSTSSPVTTAKVTISGNYMHGFEGGRTSSTGATVYGVQYFSGGNAGDIEISNNVIDLKAKSNTYGLYLDGNVGDGGSFDVLHNTVVIGGAHNGSLYSSVHCVYLSDYDDGNFKNNIVWGRTTNLNYPFLSAFGGGFLVRFDKNGVYDFENNNLIDGFVGTGNKHIAAKFDNPVTYYSSLDDWKASEGSAATVGIAPNFVDQANGDYTPASLGWSNAGVVTSVTEDFSGAARGAMPDIGALEFFVDLGLVSIDITDVAVCSPYKGDVVATFKNNSANPLTNVPVRYSVNGGDYETSVIAGPIASGGTSQITFPKQLEFFGSNSNTTLVEVGGIDDVNTNNSASHVITTTTSPTGGTFSKSAQYDGYWNAGTMMDPDATVKDHVSNYDISRPQSSALNASGPSASGTYKYELSAWDGITDVTSNGFSYTDGDEFYSVDPDVSIAGKKIRMDITVSEASTGCDTVIQRWMYVPHTPVPSFRYSNACLGDVSQFKNTSTLGGTSYIITKWEFDDPDGSVLNDSSNIKDGFWTYTTYGKDVNIKMTVANGNYPKFTYSDSNLIDVTPKPTVKFDVFNACEGLPIKIQDSTSIPIAGTIAYDWKFYDEVTQTSTVMSTSTLKNPQHIFTTPGQRIVSLTASANGCESSLTKNIYQFEKPVADFNSIGQCNFVDVDFANTSTIPNNANKGYSWKFMSVGAANPIDGISREKNPSFAFATPGNKEIELKVTSEFGCEDVISKTIVLEKSPEADFTWDAACNLTKTNFTRTGTADVNQSRWFWDFNGEGTSGQQNPSYDFGKIGTKLVTFTIVDDNTGCENTITKEVEVVLQADADFRSGDVSGSTLCQKDEVSFTNESNVAAGVLNYTWRFGDGKTSKSVNPRHKFSEAKSYWVTLVADVDGGCADSSTKQIIIAPTPDATFDIETAGRFITGDAKPGYDVYAWRFGDGGKSSMENPTYEYENRDNYTFTVCLSTRKGDCWSEDVCQDVNINLAGVDELTQDNNMINVYPNPTNGKFTVNVENPTDVVVKFGDILGNVIDVEVTDNLNGSYTVNASALADGVYFVQVKNGDFYATKRITVSK